MNRIAKTLVSTVVAALLLAGQALSAGLAKSGYMERVITTRNVGASATQTEKYYWEGDRLRSEKYSVEGQMVQIKNGRILYLYSPTDKEAVKVLLPDKLNMSVQQMLQEQSGSAKGGKKVGVKRVSGFDCDVYMLSKTVGGVKRSAKLYVSTDPRLPIALKIEITMGKGSQVVESKNIKLNMNVPDSLFALPKGTKVVEKKVNAPGQAAPGGAK